MKQTEFEKLITPFEAELTDTPWQEYPRPQLKRNSYLNLNGKWKLSVKNGNTTEFVGDILVPFPPESRISEIEKQFKETDILIYKRNFELEKDFLSDRLLLHFGAVDQFCRVFVNNNLIGEHQGGYIPFTCDITKYANIGKNEITVEVSDPLNLDFPYGKQCKKRGGMWYTSISGIWQTFWAEALPDKYIESIKITPDTEARKVSISGELNNGSGVRVTVQVLNPGFGEDDIDSITYIIESIIS